MKAAGFPRRHQTRFATSIASVRSRLGWSARRRAASSMRRLLGVSSAVGRRGGQTAERLVVDQPLLRRMLAADRALRILADLQDTHVVLVRQRVEVDHLAD